MSELDDWIPVGERKPEPYTTIRCLTTEGKEVKAWVISGGTICAHDQAMITHWKPEQENCDA